jgi:hypothetical protein
VKKVNKNSPTLQSVFGGQTAPSPAHCERSAQIICIALILIFSPTFFYDFIPYTSLFLKVLLFCPTTSPFSTFLLLCPFLNFILAYAPLRNYAPRRPPYCFAYAKQTRLSPVMSLYPTLSNYSLFSQLSSLLCQTFPLFL